MLNHVVDGTSQSSWNTHFRVKVNFKGAALEATLDTGAWLSAVNADLLAGKSETTH